MRGFRWIALQGSSRGLFLPPLLLFCFITTSGIPAHAADDSAACRTPVARIVSIQGTIEVLRAHQNDWSKVTRLDTPLCEGDRLRTGALSRAALFIQPETLVRVDQNTRITISQTKEETLVEFTQEELLPAAAGAYSCGAGYFITRFPRKFKVKTPHLNAAVEGTEFLVAMRCESTELSVFEGKVLAAGAGANIFPAQSISSGQILTIGGSEPPAVRLLVKPKDAVQWVLYYPPLSDATAEADLPPAEQCRTLPKPLDQICVTQRAEALLRVGRVDEAQREVDDAVALDPGQGDANSLRAIISIARNDKAGAIEAATAATTASPDSFRAWLALSYAQQASFKLDDSLVCARKAQTLEPNSSVTNARVAELLMSLGRIKEAEVAARAAVDANPTESRAHTVLGFVHLAQIRTKEARTDFLAAIDRDSSDPLPRLGLGLAIIRTGELAEGREQLEIAVALDSTNSLLRSYVGKAYYEENSKERDKLAEMQFELAKQIDPNDPTPWFYDAILKQSKNQPAQAFEDLQKSIELNDNRAVFRSRLALDQDAAARESSLAWTYGGLGFGQLAHVEATKALEADFGDSSAHRFLADTYSGLPRYEIARASELLQAQLRQPLGATGIQSQLSRDDLAVVQRQGIFRTGVNEYSELFSRPGIGVQLYGLVGDKSTYGDEALLSVLSDRVALNVSQFSLHTDSFRKEFAVNRDNLNALIGTRLSPATSFQVEMTSLTQDSGNLISWFDPAKTSDALLRLETDTIRFGLRHELSPQTDILISVINQQRVDALDLPSFGNIITVDNDSTKSELQGLLRFQKLKLVGGIGYYQARTSETFFGTQTTSEPFHFNSYLYGYVPVPAFGLTVTLGATFDHLRSLDAGDQQVWNHKLGISWNITPATTIRAASFSTLKRRINSEQGLEPTQIAGFNQFYDDLNGTKSSLLGVGLAHRFSPGLNAGVEVWARKLTVPFVFFDVEFANWKEEAGRAYVYWLPRSWLALSAETFQERYTRDEDFTGSEDYLHLKTIRTPLTATFFPVRGVSASVSTSYIRQEGRFLDSSFNLFDGSDEYWLADTALSYRFPGRTAILSLEGRNLFDQRFNYQSTEMGSPRWALGRMVLLRFSVSL